MAAILSFPDRRSRPMAHQPSAVEMPVESAGADTAQWDAWMTLAQRGDHSAYHALLSAITPYVRAIARRYLRNREDAEDAVQEILITMTDIRHTYEPGRPFKPWLRTIASRRCIDLLRQRTRRLQNEVTTDADMAEQVAAEDSPEQVIARQHIQRDLHDIVASLTMRQRDAVRLVHLRGLSLSEAAIESEQSVGSLKVACHRALKALERRLSRTES